MRPYLVEKIFSLFQAIGKFISLSLSLKSSSLPSLRMNGHLVHLNFRLRYLGAKTEAGL